MISEATARLLTTEPDIAKLTPVVIAEALAGFPLEPSGRIDWLARAIQCALFVARSSPEEGRDRRSNTDTRDDLWRLAAKVAKIWDALGEPEKQSAIFDYAHRDGDAFGESDDYKRLKEAEASLDWLSGFLRRSGVMIGAQGQGRGWRAAARRAERVRQAQFLTLVFREAYGREPSAHTRPTTRPLMWPDFYQRVIRAAFGENVTNDLIGVLVEARERAARHPVNIAEDFWPDKPL